MNVKELAKEFRKKSVYYSQVKREGNIAIYALSYSTNEPRVGFDVVRVLRYPSDRYPGKFEQMGVEKFEIETYPYSEAFGRHGFSFDTLELANKKFDEMRAAECEKENSEKKSQTDAALTHTEGL